MIWNSENIKSSYCSKWMLKISTKTLLFLFIPIQGAYSWVERNKFLLSLYFQCLIWLNFIFKTQIIFTSFSFVKFLMKSNFTKRLKFLRFKFSLPFLISTSSIVELRNFYWLSSLIWISNAEVYFLSGDFFW